MKKILILTPGFPIDEQDNTCIPFLQDYVLALAENIGKENICIISFQYPFVPGEYLWNGITIYSAGGKNRKSILKLITWNRVMRKAKEWIVPGKMILHSFWLNDTTFIGAKLSKKYRCKLIATIMGQDILAENNYLNKISLNTILVVAPNTKAADMYKKNTGNKVHSIIRPGVKFISATHHERTIDLLFVGAFIALKQPEICIEIITQLNKEFSNLNCRMIGDGILKNKCIAATQKLQIHNIQFTGKLDRKKVIEYMHHSKVLIHTSKYEGHATVIEEAIACGMQVVCFDVGRPEHPAVHVCADKNEMCNTISNLLKTDNSYTQLTSYSIRQTVEFYQQL